MDNDPPFSRCANPGCNASFNYRQGQLFRFVRRRPWWEFPAATDSVRHLWLCKACSDIYTLVYRHGLGVLLDRRFEVLPTNHRPRLIAAA